MENDKDKKPNDNQDPNKGGDNNNGDNKGGDGKDETTIPKHRFDEVNSELQKYKKAEEKRKAEQAEAEKKRLEDEGKIKELLEKEKSEKAELQTKYERSAKANALKVEALKQGTVDADAVVALSNLDDVELSEDGSVNTQTVTAVIEKLKSEKAYLFGEGGSNNTTIGNKGGAPNGGSSQTPYFKRSQLRDSKFYEENKTEIMKAVREGRIIDDINPKPASK